MHPRQFALIAGIVLLAMGVTSFIPAFNSAAELSLLELETSYGMYLGLFPLNILNKLALGLLGIGGLAAYYSKNPLPASVTFSRRLAAVMIPAAILGLIPQTNTLFGYLPLYGGQVLMNGLFGILGAYFGYALPAKAKRKIEPLLREARSH
jgi:hypothetical protein